MIQSFELGDAVVMKKPHACGTNDWTVIRTGADVKIRCQACGRIVMMDRQEFMRLCKRVTGKRET
jgi:hypothetical protein